MCWKRFCNFSNEAYDTSVSASTHSLLELSHCAGRSPGSYRGHLGRTGTFHSMTPVEHPASSHGSEQSWRSLQVASSLAKTTWNQRNSQQSPVHPQHHERQSMCPSFGAVCSAARANANTLLSSSRREKGRSEGYMSQEKQKEVNLLELTILPTDVPK